MGPHRFGRGPGQQEPGIITEGEFVVKPGGYHQRVRAVATDMLFPVAGVGAGQENSGLAKVVPMDAVIELTSILARVIDERTASGQQTIPWQAFADAVGAVKARNDSDGG